MFWVEFGNRRILQKNDSKDSAIKETEDAKNNIKVIEESGRSKSGKLFFISVLE
jgi:hypothetical protein